MSLRLLAAVAILAWAAGLLVDAPPPARFVQEDVRIPAHNGRTTLASPSCGRTAPGRSAP